MNRKEQLAQIRADSHKIRSTVSWHRSAERAPTDEEFARVQAIHPGFPRELVSVSKDSGGIWLKMEGRSIRLNEKKAPPIGGRRHVKVYSSGDSTTAVYDPKTGKPLVFKTGSKSEQMQEMRTVVNSREWRDAHRIPDDVEINFSE